MRIVVLTAVIATRYVLALIGIWNGVWRQGLAISNGCRREGVPDISVVNTINGQVQYAGAS